jgi:hypothetical protein
LGGGLTDRTTIAADMENLPRLSRDGDGVVVGEYGWLSSVNAYRRVVVSVNSPHDCRVGDSGSCQGFSADVIFEVVVRYWVVVEVVGLRVGPRVFKWRVTSRRLGRSTNKVMSSDVVAVQRVWTTGDGQLVGGSRRDR